MPPSLNKLRAPQKLIENRISFAGPESELSIYDTYQAANRVNLQADQLLYCGMVTGRKILHNQRNIGGREFLPHQSYVMAPGEAIEIDFPDATESAPTTCLTIEISEQRVASIAERMSEQLTLSMETAEAVPPVLHTHHTTDTQQLLNRLVQVFTENHPDRDIMVDLGVSELVVRLLRHKERNLLLSHCRREPDANGMNAALHFIEHTLSQPLDTDQLAKHACMSRSSLYAEFKKRLGCSPREFQQQLRLKAAAEHIKQGMPITRTCYDLGFSSPSHFSRRFRQFFGYSPRELRNRSQDLQLDKAENTN